jgi:hypothetical protein
LLHIKTKTTKIDTTFRDFFCNLSDEKPKIEVTKICDELGTGSSVAADVSEVSEPIDLSIG